MSLPKIITLASLVLTLHQLFHTTALAAPEPPPSCGSEETIVDKPKGDGHGYGSDWECYSAGDYDGGPQQFTRWCCTNKKDDEDPDSKSNGLYYYDKASKKCLKCGNVCAGDPQFGPGKDTTAFQECVNKMQEMGEVVKNTYEVPAFNLCDYSLDPECDSCTTSGDSRGVWTALGCIPTNKAALVSSILTLSVGAAGGIALLIMLYGIIVIITSSGNPEKVAGGQQTITSALIGLLVIIFSVVILRIIGVEIFQIPGF